MSELKLKWETLNANLGDESAITQFGTLELQVEREPEGWDWCILDDCGSLLSEATVFADCKWAAQQAVEAQLSERLRLASQTLDSSWLEAEPQEEEEESPYALTKIHATVGDYCGFTSGPALFCNRSDWAALTETPSRGRLGGYTIDESSFDLTAAYRLIRKNGLSVPLLRGSGSVAVDTVRANPMAHRAQILSEFNALDKVDQEVWLTRLATAAKRPLISGISTNPSYQEQADQAQKVINHMVEEAMRTGDFSELDELPGLKENVERLIEEHLERQRPLEGKPACKYCGRLTPLVDGECKKCVEVMSSRPGGPTGYDQILAQIKREASEVEL